ncbi:endonuclease/exonuclease/phosphatase family protein [Plantactinospora sonchi]|uniref:Endonuclease/exonuclease/phosphatase family protein n=1 Tax=Plantactinospora sonchi TaxID=1544735 RepID=A0ABU7RTG3_9ACTN
MAESKIKPSDATDPGWRRRGTLILIATAVLTVLLIGHRLIPNVRGFGSLVDTGAPFLGLGVPLLALIALLRRSRNALVAVVVPAVAWVLLFGTAWLPSGDGGPARLRVASQNLRAGNPDPAGTVAAIAAAGVDLIGLQELDEAARRTVSGTLRERYPYQVSVSTVGLWSRFPIRDEVGVDTGLAWTRALRAVVAAPDGDVVVYVVHLGSARAGDTDTRDRTVAALAAQLRQDDAGRLIVLGDLNTATTDRVIEPLTELLRDAQADAGQGPGFTWPAALPMIRPDHVLYRGLTASSADVVRTPASDHRAVTAGFR